MTSCGRERRGLCLGKGGHFGKKAGNDLAVKFARPLLCLPGPASRGTGKMTSQGAQHRLCFAG